jgi:uncharacterized membrane protein
MRETILAGTNYVALIAEAAAAIIVLIGAAQTIWMFLRALATRSCDSAQMMRGRIRLGHSLSLALEFLIGADILKTAVAPNWDGIGQLAAIIAIRTVLNLFLRKELDYEIGVMRSSPDQ